MAVKSLEERGRLLADSVSAHDVLAYRGAIDTSAVLDALVALHEELNDRAFLKSPNINEFVERYKGSVRDIKDWRLSKSDFEFIRTLARGQFGIVDIVRSKQNKGVYAMKTLNKHALLSQREQAAFLEERDVLVLGKDSPWIPDLYASFQDKESLYIVMEFVAGGDLFSMLDRCENAVIDEDAARFYAAELVLAIEDLHRIGYIHRDCKPQNTLLDDRGHVKLADFGSCARIDAAGVHEAKISVPVGTCDYIAPESLQAREHGGTASPGVHAGSCDWWSLGTVLYEMLYGDPPFYSDSVPETYAKIMACEKNLVFDDSVDVSEDAKDLMRRLLVHQESRLGNNGADEIKAHPFFASVDWENIRSQDAPFVPRISSPDDTSNFSVGDEADEDIGLAAMGRASSSRLGHGREYAGEQLPFIGFTYLPQAFTLSANKRQALSMPRGPRDDPSQVRALKTKVEQLEAAALATDAKWRVQKKEWDEERKALVAEKSALADLVAMHKARALEPPSPPTPLPSPKRDSAMQTDPPEDSPPVVTVEAEQEQRAAEAKEEPAATVDAAFAAHLGEVMADAYQNLTSKLVTSLEEQFDSQTEHLGKLTTAVDSLASFTTERLDEGLQTQLRVQKKEFEGLATLVQSCLSSAAQLASTTSTPSAAKGSSPRLSNVATLSQAYQSVASSAARPRLSIGSTHSTHNSRRSISAVDDPNPMDSQPKSVVATLVNEISKNAAASSSDALGIAGGLASGSSAAANGNGSAATSGGRKSTNWSSPNASRVSRAERRVSSGMASDTLSVISNKCDKLATMFEHYSSDMEAIQKSQASLVGICNALTLTIESQAAKGSQDGNMDAMPKQPPLADDPSTSVRRSRRKTEHLRRRGVDPFGALDQEVPRHTDGRSASSSSSMMVSDGRALDLYKTATDELIATLRSQLTEAEASRKAAESRATELLEWIGRESKGRALLEDMISTAQEACRLAEEKMAALLADGDKLKSAMLAKDEDIDKLVATIETREAELRHLRRASRKALDQLADLKNTPAPQQPAPGAAAGTAEAQSLANDKTRAEFDAELQEAAAAHVKLQFEVSRLEGEVSRLESENAQLVKELGLKDKRLKDTSSKLNDAEARYRELNSRQAAEEIDGIRVRPMAVAGDDEAGGSNSKFGSTGAKSHKRFKVQLQNMQKHIEYLETKLALAVSENDALRRASYSGMTSRSREFDRSRDGMGVSGGGHPAESNRQQHSIGSGNSSSRSRPMSSMFPNLPSNMEGRAPSISRYSDRPESAGSASSGGSSSNRRRVPTEPTAGHRPRHDSFSASLDRLRSPFKGLRKHFS